MFEAEMSQGNFERQSVIQWHLKESKKSESVDILTGLIYQGSIELVLLANLPYKILYPNETSYKDDDFKAPCYVITKIARPMNDSRGCKNVEGDLTEAQTTIQLRLKESKKNKGVWLLTGSYFQDKVEVVIIGNIPKALLSDPPEGVDSADFFEDADYSASVYIIHKIAKDRKRFVGNSRPPEEEVVVELPAEDTAVV